MARVIGGTKQIPGLRSEELEEELPFAEGVLNGGMVLDVDPADLENHQASLLVNARVRRDKTSRKDGQSLFLPTKPNSNGVIRVVDFREGLFTIYRLRFTETEAHYTKGSSWVALDNLEGPITYDQLVGTIDALTGRIQEFDLLKISESFQGRFTDHATVLSNFIIANGVSRLRLLDIAGNRFIDLGAKAPRGKYVTGFLERVVTANLGSSASQVESIAWSGNRNLTEWDPLVDLSSGEKRLDTSPRATTDPISGIFSFTTVAIIIREGSIWRGLPTGVVIDPINWTSAIPGIGSNLPGSIALGKNKLIFADARLKDLIVYTPGQQPSSLGLPVRDTLLSNLDNPGKLFSGFFGTEDEYYFGVNEAATLKIWAVNVNTGKWVYDELPGCESINILDELSSFTTINDLTGTMDALTGAFSDLSKVPTSSEIIVYGYSDGVITKEDSAVQQNNSVNYTFEHRWKEFKFPKVDMTTSKFVVEYQATVAGTLTLQYSKDGGTTWTTAKAVTSLTGKKRLLIFRKQVRTRRILWRLTAIDGAFDLLGYEMSVTGEGDSRS